jgi:putative membrane protein
MEARRERSEDIIMWNCGTLPWFGGWMSGPSLLGLLILAGIGMLLWNALKPGRHPGPSADKADSLEILKLRLAKGEISIEEYNTLKSII